MTGGREGAAVAPGGGDAPADAVARLARAALGAAPDRGGGVRVVAAGAAAAPAASDSPEKFVVLEGGVPRAFAYLSPACEPAVVADGLARIAAAREALGSALGGTVLAPLARGDAAGRTAAVFPFCAPLATGRWGWRLQRPWVRRWGLRWLREVARRTRRPVAGGDLERSFAAPLDRLARMGAAGAEVRARARAALERLRAGRWPPCHVLMHGDLWRGNLVVRRERGTLRGALPWPGALAIVDWGTAEVSGYGLFDLVRFAESTALAPRALRGEVEAHCRILGCGLEDGESHLLAALGFRAMNLHHFPPERFAAMASTCVAVLDAAVRLGAPPSPCPPQGDDAGAPLV